MANTTRIKDLSAVTSVADTDVLPVDGANGTKGVTFGNLSTAALNKLKEQGLIEYEKYGNIQLTPRGGMIAKRVISRHLCLKEFFSRVLKLPEEEAENEACRIEHHISPETCKRIHKLLIHYKSDEDRNKDWVKDLGDALSK